MELGSWQGTDVPLDEGIRRIPGFDDDYINRRYTHGETERSVTVFVGYTGRPRVRLGHRPDVCYAAHGFEQVSEEAIVVSGEAGMRIPSVLYEFRSPQFAGPRQLVLATYVVNGEYVQNAAVANDYNTRGPNLFGDKPAYVARLHVSIRASGDRDADLALLSGFAGRIAQPIAEILPRVVGSY